MLCPALVFTFLSSQGKEVGKSLIDPGQFEHVNQLLGTTKNNFFYFPEDYQVALDAVQEPLEIFSAEHFPANGIGIAIGPQTIETWNKLIQQAKTVFFNAAMGFAQYPHTQEALKTLLQCVAQSPAYSVIGGGDSVAAVQQFGFAYEINFLSTGGGATLTYLSGKALPGLNYM